MRRISATAVIGVILVGLVAGMTLRLLTGRPSVAFKNSSASLAPIVPSQPAGGTLVSRPSTPSATSANSQAPVVSAPKPPTVQVTTSQTPTVQSTATPKATPATPVAPVVVAPTTLPSVTSINLQSVSGATPSVIWVFGTNLASVSEVSFGGVTSPVLHYFASQGGIEVQTPLHGPGTVDVRLISPSGMSPLTPADTITFVEPATSNIGSAQLP